MITSFIISIFDNLIGYLLFILFGIFDLLPQEYSDYISTAITDIFSYASPILKYIPAWETEWLIIRLMLGISSAIGLFRIGNWIYNKVRGSGG